MPRGSPAPPSNRAHLAVLAAFTLVLGACSAGRDAPTGSRDTTGTTAVRGSTADSGTTPGWPMYRHDLANTGAAPAGTGFTPANVANLTKSWSKDGLTGVAGTPAVADGIAYFGDWKATVWAVRADTGEAVWSTPI